jgi:GDP-4-dehydro-6-deoxy-D-mannose reductase
VTGAHGFVGRHLRGELGEEFSAAGVDVLDANAVAATMRESRPRAVVHLAGLSSVAESWERPAEAWTVNVVGTVNVLEAVRAEQPEARVLFPSTGEVYGAGEQVPTPEDAPVAPVSPYAATKAAAEIACRQSGLDVIVARVFNAEGPGRDERFAVGSWTRQIAALETEGGGTLRVGDLSAERDLNDVRDVCRAYRLLLESSIPAGIYNVASGRAVSMEDVVELLRRLARAPIAVEQDPARMRPADVPITCGDPSKLKAATGWEPKIPLEQTLADALEEARESVVAERVAKA